MAVAHRMDLPAVLAEEVEVVGLEKAAIVLNDLDDQNRSSIERLDLPLLRNFSKQWQVFTGLHQKGVDLRYASKPISSFDPRTKRDS